MGITGKDDDIFGGMSPTEAAHALHEDAKAAEVGGIGVKELLVSLYEGLPEDVWSPVSRLLAVKLINSRPQATPKLLKALELEVSKIVEKVRLEEYRNRES